MKKKQFMVILSAIGIILLLCWFFVIAFAIKNLRGLTNKNVEPVIVDVTLCDEDASNLCIINFGANNLNRLVINFQLPDADYPAFYVKAMNRDTVNVYTCEVDEIELVDETEVAEETEEPGQDETLATETVVFETETAETEVAETEIVEAAPVNAHCTGARTPLGETIDIEVYTTDKDKLIARGTFLVSAIALATPISQPTITPNGDKIPTLYPSPTIEVFPTPTLEIFPTQDESENTPTATPDIAYP